MIQVNIKREVHEHIQSTDLWHTLTCCCGTACVNCCCGAGGCPGRRVGCSSALRRAWPRPPRPNPNDILEGQSSRLRCQEFSTRLSSLLLMPVNRNYTLFTTAYYTLHFCPAPIQTSPSALKHTNTKNARAHSQLEHCMCAEG